MNERTNRKAATIAAFLLIFSILASVGHASVNIMPLRVDLGDDHDKDVIHFTNQGATTKSYEVEIVAWSQTDERREVYSPTEDILAVPPLFTVAPGEQQIIRVGMLTAADQDTERSYRMFITELAPPATEETGSATIGMRLQLGVPVFVAPIAIPNADLAYVETQKVGEQHFARFRNNGNTHVKVTGIHYTAPGLDEAIVQPSATYFLAGSSGLLPIEAPAGAQEGKITIVTESLGAVDYDLPFTP